MSRAKLEDPYLLADDAQLLDGVWRFDNARVLMPGEDERWIGVWERVTEADGTPGQWYLHLFLAEQPDLVRNGTFWAAANWLLDAAALWVFLRALVKQTMN